MTSVPSLRAIASSPWRFGLAVLGVHLLMLLPILARHGFDFSALIVAGDRFVTPGQTPAPIIVRAHSDGYDGQFYYRLALAPMLAQQQAFGIDLVHPAWRMQRILLPVLARWVALGRPAVIPFGFFSVNCAGIFSIGALASWLARRHGWRLFVPLAIGLWPAWFIALTHDTTEILACALLLGALAAYLSRAFAAYAALMALATLTRETSILAACGIFAVEVWQAMPWRASVAWRRPVLAGLAMAPFFAWQYIVSAIWRTTPQAHGVAHNAGWPLQGWVETLLANLLNRAVFDASHPRNFAMRATMLAALALISLLSAGGMLAALRCARDPARRGVAAAWVLTLLLMSLLTASGPWIDPTGILRAFSECWVVGCMLLGLAGRGLKAPWIAGLLLVFLVARNWELCAIQLH